MPDRFPVAGSLAELLGDATGHESTLTVDSLSGASFTRVLIDGESFIVKQLSRDNDWVMRATEDFVFRPLAMWRSGLFADLPSCIDPVVVGAAHDPATDTAWVLMPDIGRWLVPEGDAALTPEAHAQFMTHMAALHSSFWDWTDVVGLCPAGRRWTFLSPAIAASEAAGTDPVPKALVGGWAALQDQVPDMWKLAVALTEDPSPLADAVAQLPQTLVHGDWKGGNLGLLPGSRTALIDWAFPGQDNPLADLAWYLAVNCDRLPESKEDAVRRYRSALEDTGVSTAGWWDDALALCLLGGFVQMGWSKSGAELEWWAQRAREAAPLIGG